MTENAGFKSLEKRVEELIAQTGDIAPGRILELLRRADGNPSLNIDKELERLRTETTGRGDDDR